MVPSREQPQPVIYAGIDEAGYGPVLGPLCVSMSVFSVPAQPDAQHAAAAPPDLWSMLSDVVCTRVKESSSSRFAVADSKALKLPNSSVKKHPLTHLELGVLTFLHAAGRAADTDSALLELLSCTKPPLAWYADSFEQRVPLATTPDHVRLLSVRLAAACASAGVSLLDLRCLSIDESRFNARLRELGTKAAVSFEAVRALIRRVWSSDAAKHSCPRLVIDRQGGRTAYADLLRAAAPGAEVETIGERPDRSVYELHARPDADGTTRSLRVSFEVEAEARHFPVALASMTAKLVRELFMLRFNAYWCGRMPELKPTAGYAQDGGRWLRDLADGVTDEELTLLRRRA